MIILLKLRHFTYPFFISHSLRPDSVITALQIFLSSLFLLFVAELWLSCSCIHICFLQKWGSQNVRPHCRKCHIFMTWKKPGAFCVPNRILRDIGTQLSKTHKTGTVPENWYEWDAYPRKTCHYGWSPVRKLNLGSS
jgi:hypothetical protein